MLYIHITKKLYLGYLKNYFHLYIKKNTTSLITKRRFSRDVFPKKGHEVLNLVLVEIRRKIDESTDDVKTQKEIEMLVIKQLFYLAVSNRDRDIIIHGVDI